MSEPSYSSPRGHPLPRLHRLRVVPFLGLAIVHRPGALGAAWSMWSMTNFHRKSTVRGEADSWVHDYSKEVPPYYAENNDSSTCQQGPTGRATSILRKKCFPLTAGTHWTGHRIARKKRCPRCQLGPTRSASLLHKKNEYSSSWLGATLVAG